MIKILAGEQIKQSLYSVIEEVGKEKIRIEITSNIKSSRKYVDFIMKRCITKLASESNGREEDDYFYGTVVTTLSEALLHFMLTICTLPSERKILIKDDLVVDVIIPNLQSLKTKSDKSVIIQIIKEKPELNKISQLEFLQPNHKNIWLISAKPVSTTKYTAYYLLPSAKLNNNNNFSNIIIDIDNFLRQTGDKSLRFIH
jgi:hypothetical protein